VNPAKRVALTAALVAAAAVLPGVAAASGPSVDALRQRIVSTSGVPHGDVADYRSSPYWRSGMPVGMNKAWRGFLKAQVGQITKGADVVLHTGDQVGGRWGIDWDGTGVFGPIQTGAQRRAALELAGDTYYSQLDAFWDGHDVLWAMGDHEVGDLPANGYIAPDGFKYRAHETWNEVWKRHHGPSRYATRRGRVGIVTFDPLAQLDRGVVPRILERDLRWAERRIAELRRAGIKWLLVQSEIPAVGPNRAANSSRLMLENGDRVWQWCIDMDVDLFLAGEFHADTTHTWDGRTPVEVVHGGLRARASWLVVDEYQNRLRLTLREARGQMRGNGQIWAPSKARVNNGPVVGTPAITGRMTIHENGATSDRSGFLREGIAPTG
jgi:hypothetical protein